MPLIVPANTVSAAGYDVANSCRFDDGDTSYMHKTPGSDGNRQQFTFSCWVKRGLISSGVHSIINAQHGASSTHGLRFNADDKLDFHYYAGGYQGRLETTRLFRDPAAWYNIIAIWDTPNATANSRMRLIINGVEETAFDTRTNPGSEYNGQISWSTKVHHIGDENTSNYFDGYIAEAVLIDGSVLAATSFGEFDSDSPTIWKPIDVSGLTFGTNGFYLDFEASGNLGNDANGGADFTEVNLAAIDQCTDSPTNNFAVINPLANRVTDKPAVFSQGNTKITAANPGAWGCYTSTFGVNKGKWWMEAKLAVDAANSIIGIISENALYSGTDGEGIETYAGDPDHYQGIGYHTGGNKYPGSGGTASSYGDTYAADDIMGIALNLDDEEVKFYKNGTVQNSGTALSFTTGNEFWFMAVSNYSGDGPDSWEVNFGNPFYTLSSAANDENGYGNFEHAPPSGFLALCTKNLGSYGG